MGSGKKPTRAQRKIIASAGLDTWKWYVQQDCNTHMRVVNIETGEVKEIPK